MDRRRSSSFHRVNFSDDFKRQTIRRQPNQRLKLTELAVDDFAARQYKKIEAKPEYVRAANCMELAIRRRSLAAIR